MPASASIFTLRPQHSPAIFRLNADTLLYIFSLNANMNQEIRENGSQKFPQPPALTTLRYSSQVCADWRNLVIRSPWLWARVLNLNFLLLNGVDWMEEVLRRTGTAPLHIKSVMYHSSKWPLTAAEAVRCLLTENWGRIQILDLDLDHYFKPNKQPWFLLFERPAPAMEVFKFSWDLRSNCFLRPNFHLFSGKSPSLRALSVADMKLHLMSLPTPNLRTLLFHSGVSAFDLLDALKYMPLLEALEAQAIRGIHEESSFVEERITSQLHSRVVSLPHLTTIKLDIRRSVDTALAVIGHIIPADGCALDFQGFYQESPDQESDTLCKSILSRYSQICTELPSATNLEVVFFPDCLQISIDLPSHRRFRFSFSISSYSFPYETTSALLSSFNSIFFTKMRLNTITKLALYLREDVDHESLNPDFTRFILSFHSVEELEADWEALTMLRDIERREATLTLSTVRTFRLVYISEEDRLPDVLDFLSARVESGIPANTLTVKILDPDTMVVEPLRISFPGLTVQMENQPEEDVS